MGGVSELRLPAGPLEESDRMATEVGTPAALDGPAELDPLARSRLSRLLIAVVRVVVALLWIQNSSWKKPPDFAALRGFTQDGVDHPVLAPWAWLVQHVILPNFTFFGWVTLIVEASLGAFLLIGLATRLWAVVGIGQTIAITLSVLNTPGEWPWSYFLMLTVHVALFATAAGRFYGLDGVLRAVAAAGGWYGRRLLVAVAGAAYLLAAVAQAALIGRHGDVLGGDGSTVSFWLGLGVGLLAVGLAPRLWPDEQDKKGNR